MFVPHVSATATYAKVPGLPDPRMSTTYDVQMCIQCHIKVLSVCIILYYSNTTIIKSVGH